MSVGTMGMTDTLPASLAQAQGQVVCADNLDFMARLPDGAVDLIYADPPFATGKAKSQGRSSPRFEDAWPGGRAGFLAFLQPRLEQMHRLLARTGTLYVHLDWHAVHYVKVMLDELFGETNFLNEIIWSYRTGGRSQRWFARKHDTILVYAKSGGDHTFHVLRDGVFRTDGMKYDERGQPYKQTRSGRLYFHPDGPALTDVWEIPFLSTVGLERTGYPTQKPETLLARVIRASSNPGDLVADFFCGSGTTPAVAQRLDRRWLACDVSAEAVQLARQRLAHPPRERSLLD